MSKVIRISDAAYDRLLALSADGETPAAVVDWLLAQHAQEAGAPPEHPLSPNAPRPGIMTLPAWERPSMLRRYDAPWAIERSPDGTLKAQFLGRLLLVTLTQQPGGSAATSTVLRQMRATLTERGALTPADDVRGNSKNEWPRWESTVRFCRQRFVEEGWLRKDSKAGTWALSRDGFKAAAVLVRNETR